MSIIFDPADRGASQNAAQGNVAQGGAAQNGVAPEIPASVRNAMELNPNAAQSAGEQGGEQTPSAPTWRYEVNTPEEFQKFVQLSSQGAVILRSTRRTRPPPCRCSKACRSLWIPPQVA